MDFVTTTPIENIRQILEFMQNIFPWFSLLLLSCTALIVTLTEKRKRALYFEQSEEEARIQALPDLSENQKEDLLKAAAPLPSIREAFPLPDIPLRLVSALAKVFGFLKLFLLFGTAYAMARIFVIPGSERSVTHPFLLALLVVGFMILAILQIIASSKVMRGNNGARRFLIFMAVLDLGTALYDPNMAFAVLWRIILIGMSGYTLWVLLLRKCAQETVIFDSAPTRPWQKITLCALSLLFAITVPFDAKVNTNAFFHKLESNMSSSDIGGIILPVSRIYLLAGDGSRETSELMEYIKGNLGIPVELIEFGQVAPYTISGSDLLLLLSKTLDAGKPKEIEEKVDREFLKALAKADPEMAQLFQPQPSGDKEIGFVINSPFSHQNFAWNLGGAEMYGINSPDLRGSISAEYSQGGRKKTLEALGHSAVEKLDEYILKRNAKITINSLPEPLRIEPTPLSAPDLVCMSNAIFKARYNAPGQQISLYQTSEYIPEVMTAVSNELVSAGWKPQHNNRFKKGDEQVTVLGPAAYARQRSLPIIYFIHAKSRPVELPDSFPADLCRNHYADFIFIFRAKAVPEEVMRDATLKYLKQPELSAKELYKVYSSISNVKALESIRPNLLWRFAKQLHAEPMSEFTFDLYDKMAKEMATESFIATNIFDRLKELYVDQVVRLKLEKNANGFARAEMTLQCSNRPLLVTLSGLPDDLPERAYTPYFLMWMESLEDGRCKSCCASPYGSTMSEGAEFPGFRMTLHRFTSEGYAGMSSGGFADKYCAVESMTDPGNLTLLGYRNPADSGELIIKFALNENEPVDESEERQSSRSFKCLEKLFVSIRIIRGRFFQPFEPIRVD